MKKVVCLFLSVVFTLCAICSAFSETVKDPLEEMSLDELFALRDKIDLIIQEQKLLDGEIEIPSGSYVVGSDIPEGAYLLRVVRYFRNSPVMEIRDLNRKHLSHEYFSNQNQQLRINLAKDTVLYLDPDGVFTIKKADPLF